MDILAQLTAIRQGSGSFHEKAQGFVEILRQAGVGDIELMSCDVCEEDLHPGHSEMFRALCQELDTETQMEEIIQRLDAQTRPEAFVRVQAQTDLGYLTFCFFCDSTMCGNQVEYSENPDWDSLQMERALRYVVTHPEWDASGILMSGSTRHRVVFDLLVPAGQDEPQFLVDEFEGCIIQVSLTPEDDVLLRIEPRMRDLYEPIQQG